MPRTRSSIATVAFLGLFGFGVIAGCAAPSTAGEPAAAAAAPTATTAPAASPSATSFPATAATPTASTASQAATAAKINLNTATDSQFLAIPNVGNNMLREFREYRPYTSIEQFRREIGKYVSAEQVAAYEKYVYVPVDPNAATAATFQQLPGVDATIAQQLIAARSYASTDAFLAKLGEYVSADQVAAARTYLT